MKKVIGIILIITALVLGYVGITEFQESTNSIEIGDLELSADDESGKTMGYVYLGGSVLLLIAGIYTLTGSKK